MTERKYRYETQDQLKLLISLLAESSVKASVMFQAVASTDFYVLHDTANQLARKIDHQSKERVETVLLPILRELVPLAEEWKVIPFTTIEYDFSISSTMEVRRYSPYHYENQECIELYSRLDEMQLVYSGWVPVLISMMEAKQRQHILRLKNTVKNLVPNRYHVTYFRVGLNPVDLGTSDHYYDRGTGYDATVEAGEGIITVNGKNTEPIVEPLKRIGIKEQSLLVDRVIE